MSLNALISAGSNVSDDVNDAAEAVLKSRLALSAALSKPVISSRIYKTPAFPKGFGPDFANAVFAVQCDLDASELVKQLHQIEADAGRERAVRWGQRSLDLDLIAFGEVVLPDLAAYQYWRNLPIDRQMKEAPTELILPHPRLQDRPFVLVPMLDVAPDWVHPVSKLTVHAMLKRCSAAEIASVVPLN